MNEGVEDIYGGPSLPIKKKNENKKIKEILRRKKTHKVIMAYKCQI